MAISDVIEGETAGEFQARVEAAYNYRITKGERWVLWGDQLIVAHPERHVISVELGGQITPITFEIIDKEADS